MNNNNNKLIIFLMGLIIIILSIFCFLLASGYLVVSNKNNNNIDDKPNNIENSENCINNEITTRNDVIKILKTKLTDTNWVRNNLYSNTNCFKNDVDINEKQNLKFVVINPNNENPYVVVENKTDDLFISTVYKVYFDGKDVVVKNITDTISHPQHVVNYIDVERGYFIHEYGHMGYYKFTSYNLNVSEFSILDDYNCTTGDCDYNYEGSSNYNMSLFEIELNTDNVNKYLK